MEGTPNYIWCKHCILGNGVCGNVYKGRNKITGKLVAIKQFDKQETDILQDLSHTNIISMLATDCNAKGHVSILEYCQGDLKKMLQEPQNLYGLCEKDMIQFCTDVLSGVSYLQAKHICHRDIKPANILVHRYGRYIFKIADFGFSRRYSNVTDTAPNVCGTIYYCHPNVLSAIMDHTKHTYEGIDLWSVAVTMYEAATGMVPFIGTRPELKRLYMTKTKNNIAGSISANAEIFQSGLPDTCVLTNPQYFTNIIKTLMLGNAVQFDYTLVFDTSKCAWDTPANTLIRHHTYTTDDIVYFTPDTYQMLEFANISPLKITGNDVDTAKKCICIFSKIQTEVKKALNMQKYINRAVLEYNKHVCDKVHKIDILTPPVLAAHAAPVHDIKKYSEEYVTKLVVNIKKYSKEYVTKLVVENQLLLKWNPDMCTMSCYEKCTHFVEVANSCHNTFLKNLHKTLSYNEQQIHLFEKRDMLDNLATAKSLLYSCRQKTKRLYTIFTQWYNMAYKISNKVDILKSKLDELQQ